MGRGWVGGGEGTFGGPGGGRKWQYSIKFIVLYMLGLQIF